MPRTIKITAATAAEASRIYCAKRDAAEAAGRGGSKFPHGQWGRYSISYNGKVWEPDGPEGWVPGRTPVYDPYKADAS